MTNRELFIESMKYHLGLRKDNPAPMLKYDYKNEEVKRRINKNGINMERRR